MKKIFLSVALSLLIIPQVAFAAWWNPFTWKIFKRTVEVKAEQTVTVSDNATSAPQQSEKKVVPQKADQALEIEKLKKEVEELKKASPAVSVAKPTPIPSPSPEHTKTTPVPLPAVTPTSPKISEATLPVEKNFKEPTLTALKNKIEAHRAIVNWIDNDMLVLLSQRESMLSDAISRTNNVMNNETDHGLRSIYPFLIAAYDNDRSQFIMAFRKTCLTVRTSSEKNAEILTGDYVKISAESLITESQYSSILQNLENAQKNWQTNYDISKYVYSEFTKQANLRNEKYQYMISEIAQLITITSKNEAMQTALNELRAQQVRPINCTITSNNNGFSTEGRISCY